MAMAMCSAFLVFVSLQFGWGLRADQGQSDELRTGKCCCYRPATWHVYTNPFGKACPLEGDTWSRGCVKGLGKAAPCANGPTRDDVYCEIYYALDCNSTLRNPAKIMWNKPWEKRYRELTLRKLTTEGWEDMARRPLYNITGNVKESTTVPYHHTFEDDAGIDSALATTFANGQSSDLYRRAMACAESLPLYISLHIK